MDRGGDERPSRPTMFEERVQEIGSFYRSIKDSDIGETWEDVHNDGSLVSTFQFFLIRTDQRKMFKPEQRP